MHTQPMKDSDGDFKDWEKSENQCRQCSSKDTRCRSWDSSCGGYTDYQYRCMACGATWWIDGIDS